MAILNQHSAEILVVLFFIITYFMSVFEKITDWKGTITYYKNHFKNSIIKNSITFLLTLIVFLETFVLILLCIGLFYLLFESSTFFIKMGLNLSAITLLLFLFGQRLAKDYPGAMNIAVYFILNIIGIYILT
jgi:uncharacterized membrane protein YphA (DoxX/SURF4 family)